MNNKNNIVIAGGGTGGHLFPAIAIGEEMILNGYNIKFIGSKKGFDAKYLKESKYDYKLLDIYGYKRGLNLRSLYLNIGLFFKFIFSTAEMFFVFLKYKPIAVIGTGGYISAIPLMLGRWFKKKVFIQEQNIIPGRTTRLFSKYADRIFTGFNEDLYYKKNDNLVYSGNPIRKFKKITNQSTNLKTTILIVGGSQGAQPINNFFINNYKELLKENVEIIWQCGEKNFNGIKQKLNNENNIKLLAFINDMQEAYANSDLVISRAGAISISELMIFNKPSILIPYPHASDNHQYWNAKYIESRGAGILIEQEEMEKKLINQIKSLINNKNQVKRIRENTKTLAKSKSTKIIASEIIDLIK